MTPTFQSRHGQRGAVAVMVAVVMVAFIGLLGIVIDLGNLFIRKTELQNAADAAALAGAKRLDGTAPGITNAVNDAKAMAALNASDFDRTAVVIADANIEFASDPDGPWSDVATAQTQPFNKRFIKVDTTNIGQGTRPTWFMRAVSAAHGSTTATAMAVAGAPICENLPMFVCAPDPSLGAAGNWGFVAGQAYRLADEPGGPGPGNVGYMDPVPPGAPALINGADQMRDIMCQGKTFCITGPGTYSSLTQPAFGTMANALNTRFDDYGGLPADLTPEVCRPDTNIQAYKWDSPANGMPKYWMDPPYEPVRQSDDPEDNDLSTPELGVRWSAVRPGTTSQPPVNSNYPATGTPYTQPTGSIYHTPPRTSSLPNAQPNRRIITMGLATNCLDAAGEPQINGSGKPVEIPGFAQFLMPVKAVGTGSPTERGIYAEFIRVVPTPPSSLPEIKLFR